MIVGNPWILALVVPAAAAVFLTLRGRGYPRGKMFLLGAIRVLLGAFVVLAAADVQVRLPSPRRHVIFLIDRSPSFADRAASAEKLVADRRATLGPDDEVTLLHFDRRASAEAATRAEDATDIEAALDAAGAAIPAGDPGVVFLLTDGIETRGDATSAAMRLAARGIPVYIPRPAPTAATDARVVEIAAPRFVAKGEPVRISCRIDATKPMSAAVEILRDDTVIDGFMAEVPTAFSQVDTPPGEGLHVYTARVDAEGDGIPQNNALSAPVVVHAPPLVLYLAGYTGETPVESLLKSLAAFRFRRLESGAALTPEALADASVVVLDNFPASRLGGASADLATYVRDAGGGLMMIGGPGSFGTGGYIDTAMDDVLPVYCDPRDAHKKPLALVVVLDASGSMGESGGEKMDIARTAAARMLARLSPRDEGAVVAFRVEPQVVVPLGAVADAGALARTLAQISPTGGTNIFPALDRALALLAESKAPLRHVILLSDGKTLPGDEAGTLARYQKAGVTLSATATGADADRKLLEWLATETKGRYYEAARMSELADIFLDDLRRIDGPLVREGTLDLRNRALPVHTTQLPLVAKYNRTRLRDSATEMLFHAADGQDEPVLAVRRVGLGKSVALTASFERTWVGGFAAWPQWADTVAVMLRTAHRWEPTGDFALDVRREGGAFDVTVTAGPAAPPLARAVVRLSGTGAAAVEVPLTRISARAYHASTDTRLDGVVSAALVARAADADYVLTTAYVPTAYPREFREFAPRLDLLERVARITGGGVVDSLERFRVAGGSAPKESRDATPWLIAAALALFLAELVGRAVGRL